MRLIPRPRPGEYPPYGVANGSRASVRALGWHIAGHELHHLKLIRDRYLAG